MAAGLPSPDAALEPRPSDGRGESAAGHDDGGNREAAPIGETDADLDADLDGDDAIESQARAALQALAELDGGKGVSLPRLAKRTGLRVSVLLRLYTLMSDARVGDQVGPGWVQLKVDEDGGRWLARLTPAGRGEPDAAPAASIDPVTHP